MQNETLVALWKVRNAPFQGDLFHSHALSLSRGSKRVEINDFPQKEISLLAPFFRRRLSNDDEEQRRRRKFQLFLACSCSSCAICSTFCAARRSFRELRARSSFGLSADTFPGDQTLLRRLRLRRRRRRRFGSSLPAEEGPSRKTRFLRRKSTLSFVVNVLNELIVARQE